MNVLILRNHVPVPPGVSQKELLSELDVIRAAAGIERALSGRGHRTALEVVSGNVLDVLVRYDPREWLIFNLVESLDGRADLEPYVLAMYESQGFTYTAGPPRTHYDCLHKDRAKQIFQANGIATPSFCVAHDSGDPLDVPLPAIVKPVREDASIGIPLNAVATTRAELRQRVEFIVRKHGQAALVEEYIAGREFYVGVWGNREPEVLPLSEMDFSRIADPLQRISSYEVKWEEGTELFDLTPAICPAQLDEDLAERVRDLTRRAYRALGCRDYAHADIRVRDGIPYLLEINPACDLSEGMGFSKQARVAGYSYPEAVDRILGFAAERRNHHA